MDEIIVGTYEGYLVGYALTKEDRVNKMKQTFAIHSHTGSVRSISIAGKFLASGGTDDKIIIIDLKSRKEHTVLMHHDGTVNTLIFTNGGTHLISGSDDGSIVVTRVGNWQTEKKWKKAHGGQPVISIAMHPTDKLALSLGGDKTLRTWNFIKGRPAFTINLSSKGLSMATDVSFSPGGDRFAITAQQTVDVWTISKAGVEKKVTCNSKPTCVQWIDDEKLFVGLESGNIINLSVSDNQAMTCRAHKQRVKCLCYDKNVLYSVSSSGELKLWSVLNTHRFLEKDATSIGCRATCMILNKQNCFVKKEDEEINVENEMNYEVIAVESSESKPSQKGGFVSISYDDDEPKQKKRKKKNKKEFN
ncbi:p21-activated protein kinase-interacting protein 1-like [Eumeta japonica]|uniref:p21-activated protein kinase-interacting protein 1-like n=1 Tax=Eumeta variegata TaxID=151549 RepID=A0A4C1ZGG7_EUMVA|nr:p21-activated protein kinase-interacting protein 1-like [Eumeta japonica]